MAHMLTRAGRYQIISELGRGSMGVVYQGFDPVIGRTVAIKTMLIEGLSAAEFQEYKARFQREAQAAGILAHPNIVTVYDFGEDEGVLFLAMELLEGKSLQDLVENQKLLPVETILPIFEQVCSALDHAHKSNIVHRDIKPANIMILNSGLVKVTDFGIAKMMSMGMTQAGQILGTPNYMSPEQVKGRAVDGRADIFALGVILYELVTGEKPFGGQNITTVIYKIINENPIPPRELDSTIHPGLSFVISKALAKSPDERFQTCRELAEALKNYRTLGAEPPPSATVVIRVPPIQTPLEVEPLAAPMRQIPRRGALETPPQRPAQPVAAARTSARVPSFAAAKPPDQGWSPFVWALLVLLLLGGVGAGGYYFLYLRNPAAILPNTTETAPATQTSPAQSPVQNAPAAPASAIQEPASAASQTPTAQTTGGPPAAQKPASRTEPRAPAPSAEPVETSSAGLKYGKVFVNSTPLGAQISIDGRSDPNWVTPHTIDGLKSGEHKLVLSAEGYASMSQTVTVEAGKTVPITVALAQLRAPAAQPRAARTVPQPRTEEPTATPAPAPASTSNSVWRIVTVPPGAEIAVDGKAVGPSPVQQALPAGKHTYTIIMNGVEVYNGEVDLPANQITVTRVTLAAP